MERLLRRVFTLLGVAVLAVASLGAVTVEEEPWVLPSRATVSVTQTQTVPVHVSQDAVLDLSVSEDRPDAMPASVTVDGPRDNYVGVVLASGDPDSEFVAAALRAPTVEGRPAQAPVVFGVPASADRPMVYAGMATGEPPTCTRCRIPAGDYRLHVVAEGGPATVTLTLEDAPAGHLQLDGRHDDLSAALAFSDVWTRPERPDGGMSTMSGGERTYGLAQFGSDSHRVLLVHQWDVEATAGHTPAGAMVATACEEGTHQSPPTRRDCRDHIAPAADTATWRSQSVRKFDFSMDDPVRAQLFWDAGGDVSWNVSQSVLVLGLHRLEGDAQQDS